MKKLVGGDKDILTGKANDACASKAKKVAASHGQAGILLSPRKLAFVACSGDLGGQMP